MERTHLLYEVSLEHEQPLNVLGKHEENAVWLVSTKTGFNNHSPTRKQSETTKTNKPHNKDHVRHMPYTPTEHAPCKPINTKFGCKPINESTFTAR